MRLRLVLLGLFSFGVALACGGLAERSGGNPSAASGGSPTNGTGGTDGAGGTIGQLPKRCDIGRHFMCDGAPSVYRNDEGECTGSGSPYCAENTFSSVQECLDACPDAIPEEGSCDHDYECVLHVPGCCPPCPQDLDGADYQPYRKDRLKISECDVLCGACEEHRESDLEGQYFVAACSEGRRCEAWDIRHPRAITGELPVACSEDDDCFLRDGAGCCEGCDGEGYVALSSLDFLADACAPNQPCPSCPSILPATLRAYCDQQEGKCKVEDMSPNP